MPPKAGGQANPSTKRKPSVKTNRPPKKPKVTPELTVKLKAETKKTATLPAQGKGKGLMTSHVSITEKPPVLLHEIPSMRLSNFRPSSLLTIMRT